MNIPANLKYAKTDEWVKVDGNVATIGISDYAQDSLSDIVFWEPCVEVGDQVEKGSAIATMESVKAAADVNSPVSGKVVAISSTLGGKPEAVNQDPYGTAWMIKIEMSNASELSGLMDAAAYEKDIQQRGH